MDGKLRAHQYETYDSDIQVEMGEWAASSHGQFMETIGLGPCVGLALFDPVNSTGYMAHTCGSEIHTLLDLLDAAAKDITQVSQVKAWVSGGELDPEDTDEKDAFYPAIREDVLAMLATFGIRPSNLKVQWVEGRGQVGNLYLDCATGNGGILVENLWDDHRPQEDLIAYLATRE